VKHIILIVIHIALQILAFTSWLWLDYRLVAIVAGLHLLMLEILKGCPLSQFQFKTDSNKRFYEWELDQIGIKLTARARRVLRLYMQYVLPLIIVVLAVLLQVVIGFRPIISF
jgi:hypothetical protein